MSKVEHLQLKLLLVIHITNCALEKNVKNKSRKNLKRKIMDNIKRYNQIKKF